MSEARKLPGESWESFADRRIREAQEEGAFDRLPGFGRPIPGLDEPQDENWWIREKLRREEICALPPILEMRLEREKTLESVWALHSEAQVRRTLEKLNERIRAAHYSHVRGPADGVSQVDVDAVVQEWKSRRTPTSPRNP